MSPALLRIAGLAAIAVSGLCWLRPTRAARCCNNPATCLCELRRTIHRDILAGVRALPEGFDVRSN